MNKKLLNIKEASEYLGLATGTLYNLVSERQIKVVRLLKRCIRFNIADLDELIKKTTVEISKNTIDNDVHQR